MTIFIAITCYCIVLRTIAIPIARRYFIGDYSLGSSPGLLSSLITPSHNNSCCSDIIVTSLLLTVAGPLRLIPNSLLSRKTPNVFYTYSYVIFIIRYATKHCQSKDGYIDFYNYKKWLYVKWFAPILFTILVPPANHSLSNNTKQPDLFLQNASPLLGLSLPLPLWRIQLLFTRHLYTQQKARRIFSEERLSHAGLQGKDTTGSFYL